MAKRGGGFGGMGMGMPANMNNIMKQAQKLQKQMEESQQQLEASEFESTAGGGAVSVKISGKREILSVQIAPEVVDPDDIEMLQDLIVAAVNSAIHMVDDAAAENLSKYSGALGGALGGGLPF